MNISNSHTRPPSGIPWLTLGGLFLLSRIVLFAVAMFAATTTPGLEHTAGAKWESLWCQFDCNWYLNIAQYGYSTVERAVQPGATNLAFYPLYPVLVSTIAHHTGGGFFWTGFFLSNLFFLVSLVYIYRYAVLIGKDENTGILTVAILCFFPQSIVFSVPYSESLFLMLLAFAAFQLRRENFFAAGIAAAALSATRATGVFFALFSLIWVWRNRGWRVFAMPWRTPEVFVPFVFAPLGVFLFWAYCFHLTGDAFAQPSTELHGWGYQFVPLWKNLPAMLQGPTMLAASAWISVGVFACSLLLLREKLYEDFVFCFCTFLLIWSSPATGSLFRYWLVLFPVWIVVAHRLTRHPIWTVAAISSLALINGFITYAWIMQYLIAI
ncbi:MAG: mannosyltransferase family protein [Sulfuricaulis sp.]